MGQEKTKKAAPKIVPVGQSGLLDRVKQFLPQMQEANHRLMDIQHPEELDIEKLSKQHKNNYIEIVNYMFKIFHVNHIKLFSRIWRVLTLRTKDWLF